MVTNECIVSQCRNNSEGRLICVDPDDDGWICEPCWTFLKTGNQNNSQLSKNGITLDQIMVGWLDDNGWDDIYESEQKADRIAWEIERRNKIERDVRKTKCQAT